MQNNFHKKLVKDQIYINDYIKDLKDYFYDLQGMRSDPQVQAVWEYSRLKRMDKSDDVISDKLKKVQFKYFKRYPHLINSTMILLVYSFLEGYLEDLALFCTKQFSDNIKDKALGISIDIERSKVQIETLSKCSFDTYEKEWKKIHIYREVRNCILHYNSNITRMNKKAFTTQVKRSKEFEITMHGYLRVIHYKNIYDFIETIYKYLEGVLLILSAGKLSPLSIETDWEFRIKELINKNPGSEIAKSFKAKYGIYLY